MPQDDIETAITKNTIDLGIVFNKSITQSDHSSELESFILFEETLLFAFGRSHPRAGQLKQMDVNDCNREPLVLLNRNFALRHHIDVYCAEHNICLKIPVETNSLSVIIELIQMGPLATILPGTIIKKTSGLKAVEVSPALPKHTVSLVWHKGRYKNPACRAFLEMASDWSARLIHKHRMM